MKSDNSEYYKSKEYAAYWFDRVAEADAAAAANGPSKFVEKDTKVLSTRGLNQLLGFVPITAGQRVLDIGCGFGRTFPYLLSLGTEVVGIDPSVHMLKMLPDSLRYDERVRFLQAEAEHLPFADGTFDHLVVIGAFDEFEQHVALSEMLRVCRPDGYLFFSGKNSSYCGDDEEALIAERNARRKGFPNHFTNFDALTNAFEPAAKISTALYFVKRKDLAPLRYVQTRPSHFYHYLILVRRSSQPAYKIAKPITSEVSSTWEKLYGKTGE